MSVHENTLKGLTQALEYIRGDKTKGRSEIVVIRDEEAVDTKHINELYTGSVEIAK
ncbi:MAG: hypothetical protein LBE35_03765 [Clostridiales bacterium]|jgi:hypothetical protein|nr:hypothetical protein [Clostridiales bacterium]